MQKMLVLRIVTIVLLTLALLIPLGLVQGVVSERRGLQSEVETTIAASSSGAQQLAGPVLVVPYILHELVVSKDDKGREHRRWTQSDGRMAFVPTNLDYDAKVDVEEKYKGLYKSLVYQTKGVLKASYDVPKDLGLNLEFNPVFRRLEIGRAHLAVGLTDVRGLRGTPAVTWNAASLAVNNNTNWEALGDGFHASVGVLGVRESAKHAMTMQLNFAGMRSLGVAPIGKTTVVRLQAGWPHPNFGGRFLPTSREITSNGFTAKWEISQLASKNASIALNGAKSEKRLEAFDVAFIEPVNVYSQAERAVKYGVLFIVLTFAAFFLMETLKSLRIHPLQYGLVGLALALFFLLLVSLSEHIAFMLAYLAASTACVALITYYLAHVLGGWKHGALFGLKLTLLYGVLYGLLLSEDNALMLGALLLFVALSALMTITRRVNWYEIGRAK